MEVSRRPGSQILALSEDEASTLLEACSLLVQMAKNMPHGQLSPKISQLMSALFTGFGQGTIQRRYALLFPSDGVVMQCGEDGEKRTLILSDAEMELLVELCRVGSVVFQVDSSPKDKGEILAFLSELQHSLAPVNQR